MRGRARMKLAHITMSSLERRALARGEAERRSHVRALVGVCGSQLAVFNIVDEHLHLLVRCDWPARLAESVRRVLSAHRRDLELTRPHVKPVNGQDHLRNAVPYILNQTDHHQVGGSSPPLWTGSAFLDLIGARLLVGFDLTVLRQELPRLRARHLYEAVGLEPVELVLAGDDELHRAGPAQIAELAAAVFAAGPGLTGRSAETVKARALAARVARDLGIATDNIARFIGVVPRAARRLTEHVVEQRAIEALRRRLSLEHRVLAIRR